MTHLSATGPQGPASRGAPAKGSVSAPFRLTLSLRLISRVTISGSRFNGYEERPFVLSPPMCLRAYGKESTSPMYYLRFA